MSATVEVLSAARAASLRAELAAILADCVTGGASISFMNPFGEAEAAVWWDGVVASVAAGTTVLFGGFVDGALVGSAQLGLDVPPNQPHRADVKKVIVHSRARGQGVAAALMQSLEAEAKRRGLELLVLDTVTGSAADRLYRRLGWQEAGTIPRYALWPDGGYCDATVFWKAI